VPTPQAERLTATYRKQTLALKAATVRDLLKLWPALDWKRLDATYPAWALAVGQLVQRNRQASAALSGAYLQAFRSAEGVDGPAPLVISADLNPEQLAVSLRVSSVVAAKKAAEAGRTQADAMRSAFVLSSGEMSKLVLNAGRETLLQSLAKDGKAVGWQRVVSGGACNFCRMLAGRGAVYSADTVDFHTHGHCGCTAEPVYL
jgi:hypothetical protein